MDFPEQKPLLNVLEKPYARHFLFANFFFADLQRRRKKKLREAGFEPANPLRDKLLKLAHLATLPLPRENKQVGPEILW